MSELRRFIERLVLSRKQEQRCISWPQEALRPRDRTAPNHDACHLDLCGAATCRRLLSNLRRRSSFSNTSDVE